MKPTDNASKYIKIAIFVCFLFLVVVISPFLSTLIIAAILVTGAHPLHSWILKKVNNREWLAAAIVSFSMGILFSFAFVFFFIMLSQEAVSTYQQFEFAIQTGKLNLHQLISKASEYAGISPGEIISSITSAAQSFSSTIVSQSTDLIKSIVWMLVNFCMLVFSMYVFFKDGKKIIAFVESVLPFSKEISHELLQKFRQVSVGMLYGTFLTSLLQGIIGGIGLAIAGIGNPIFWGTAMGFFGIVPVVGTGIIWVPASIYLVFSGHLFAGVALALWCGLLVAFVDNLVKPLLISKHINISPLATFLVILGGLLVFGLKGAIIAPMVLVAFVSLKQIDQTSQSSDLES